MVAAPIYANGTRGGGIAGVVYFVPPETFLNDIVSSINISENCRAYMINKNGDTIADITLDTITTQNVEREAQSDSSLKGRARTASPDSTPLTVPGTRPMPPWAAPMAGAWRSPQCKRTTSPIPM